ncbi:MAG: hypothetical protein GTN76_14165 [Candidatus Aenigmarchaeota archaeon]|nr:hypothetical protein [Candidatus Aenigmarchaeota archaeon]
MPIFFILLSPVIVSGQFPPVRKIEILYPKDFLNITQGRLTDVPVNINNTGNTTLANLNVTFVTPEGWHSNSKLIKILHPEVDKIVYLNIKPPDEAYGYYNVTLRVFSPLAGMDVRELISTFVHGEKPPEVIVEEGLKKEADDAISKARDSLQKALDMDLNVTSASNVFSQAVDNYNQGNYTEAVFLAGLSYNASEKLIAERPNETSQPRDGEEAPFDYTFVLVLLVFVLLLIAINKYFL